MQFLQREGLGLGLGDEREAPFPGPIANSRRREGHPGRASICIRGIRRFFRIKDVGLGSRWDSQIELWDRRRGVLTPLSPSLLSPLVFAEGMRPQTVMLACVVASFSYPAKHPFHSNVRGVARARE